MLVFILEAVALFTPAPQRASQLVSLVKVIGVKDTWVLRELLNMIRNYEIR